MEFGRRSFLKNIGLASSGFFLNATFLNQLNALANVENPKKIVILGAGIAGICSAYELEQRGHNCTILEAEPKHVGGRIRTSKMANGQTVEFGAMRLPAIHSLTMHYVNKFGLKKSKFYNSCPNGYYFLRGKKVRKKDILSLYSEYNLTFEEQKKSPTEIWENTVGNFMAQLSEAEKKDLYATSLSFEKLIKEDKSSFLLFLQKYNLSPDAIDLLLATNAVDIEVAGGAATEIFREEVEQIWSKDFYQLDGGTKMLPQAFLAKMKCKPQNGCEVIGINQLNTKKVSVIYKQNNAEKMIEADYVICTIPFPALQNLKILPGFSTGKQRAIRELRYDTGSKIFVQTKNRFWEKEDKIYGGASATDMPITKIYYPSDNVETKNPDVSNSSSVFLASYCWGAPARNLSLLNHKEKMDIIKRQTGRIHPQLLQKGMIEDSVSWNWADHRWSGGGYAYFLPGQQNSIQADIVKPEGRIFFAGEHCSLHHAWVQGALESALVSVKGILEDIEKNG